MTGTSCTRSVTHTNLRLGFISFQQKIKQSFAYITTKRTAFINYHALADASGVYKLTPCTRPKKHPIPYVMHYYWPRSIGLCSNVVHYIENSVQFGLQPIPFLLEEAWAPGDKHYSVHLITTNKYLARHETAERETLLSQFIYTINESDQIKYIFVSEWFPRLCWSTNGNNSSYTTTFSDFLNQTLFYRPDTHSRQAANVLPNKYLPIFYARFEVALIIQPLHALLNDICPEESQK